jgi:pilus assembly protein Flp/PilA
MINKNSSYSQGEIMKQTCIRREKGQGLVEYSLILVLVAIVVIAALMVLGPIIGDVFSDVNSSLTNINDGGSSQSSQPTGCQVKHANGYATAPGDPNGACYAPGVGYYNP